MNDRLIATDSPLTPEQRDILTALADTIVPPSDNGLMPSAADAHQFHQPDRAGQVGQAVPENHRLTPDCDRHPKNLRFTQPSRPS